MFNVLVMLRLWKKSLRGETIRIWCDNKVSVDSFTSGRAKNTFMSACLRELWWLACTEDMFLSWDHIKGEKNVKADVLSRAFNSPSDWHKFVKLEKTLGGSLDIVTHEFLTYPDRI